MRFTTLVLLAALVAPASRAEASEPVLRVTDVHVCTARGDLTRPPRDRAECVPRQVESVDPQGTALWMLADVTIPAALSASRAPMAVLMQSMASTAIYWDNAQIGVSGRVGLIAEHELPGQFVHIAPLRSDELRPGVHRLAVLMSSHRGPVRVQRPVHVLAVAPLDLIRDGVGSGSTLVQVLLGGLLLATIYFMAISVSFTRRGSRVGEATVLAAMIACALMQCAAELWRTFVPISYVAQQWRLVIILLAATGFGAALVAYTTRRFAPTAARQSLAGFVVMAALVWLFPGFDLRTVSVLAAAGIIALLTTFPAARRGEAGARAIVAVLAILIVTGAIEAGAFLDRELFVGVTALVLVLLIDHVQELRRMQASAAIVQRQVEQLEQELIRRRLTPHWLLNMLNALTAWIEEEPATAVRMVGLLGDEFHRLAHPLETPLISAHEELKACERLLSLMSLRSGRSYTLDAHGVSPALQVPPGVLHTLVENALTHGRYRRDAVFTVRQDIEGGSTVLVFEAPGTDEGSTPERTIPDPTNGVVAEGFGLTYVRARLRTAFGESALLAYGRTESGGWRTQLRLGSVSA